MAMRVTDYVSFTTNNCFCILQLSNRDILLTLFFFYFPSLNGRCVCVCVRSDATCQWACSRKPLVSCNQPGMVTSVETCVARLTSVVSWTQKKRNCASEDILYFIRWLQIYRTKYTRSMNFSKKSERPAKLAKIGRTKRSPCIGIRYQHLCGIDYWAQETL